MLSFPLILFLCLLTSNSQTVIMKQRTYLFKGSCKKIGFLYENMPLNTNLTFRAYPALSLSITPSVFQLQPNPPEDSATVITICSVNKQDIQNRIFVSYIITNKQASFNHQANNTLIIDLVESTADWLEPVRLVNQNKSGNYAEFMVETPGSNGVLYYSVAFARFPVDISMVFIESCKQDEQLCSGESQAPVFLNISSRRSMQTILEAKRITQNTTLISIDYDLFESTSYKICSFYKDSRTNYQSKIGCQLFDTDGTEKVLRAQFKFAQRISLIKLNAFLCFMVNYLGTHLRDVVSIDGLSCNIHQLKPERYFYKYKGQTVRSLNETILYIYQNKRNRLLRWSYQQIWNDRKMMSSRFMTLLKEYQLDWIVDGRDLGEVAAGEMLNPSRSIGMNYTNMTVNRTQQEGKGKLNLRFQGLNSKENGVVYFAVVEIPEGADESKANMTSNNILECKLNDQSLSLYAFRLIFPSRNQYPFNYSINLQIDNTSTFKIYYIEVSQYPKIPIVLSQRQEIIISSEKKKQSQTQKEIKKGAGFMISALYLVICLLFILF